MAGSERKRRSIVEGCKYRAIARVLQHKDARAAIGLSLLSGSPDPEALRIKAEAIRNKLADDDFDVATNRANADYVKRFAQVCDALELPNGELLPGKTFPGISYHSVRIAFAPNLILMRKNSRTNTVHRGALMLRYAKGQALADEVGAYQSAAIFGLLSEMGELDNDRIDKSLCLTLDAHTGKLHSAPGNALTRWQNIKAACQTIAERWPNIPPPAGAILE